MTRCPYFTFVALMILAATFILTTLDRLPGTVATNFGADNLANGWMTRGGYCWFILGFALALPLVVFGIIGWLSGAMPTRVNIPNRAYWLAPERRAGSLAYLRLHSAGLGSLLALFAAAVHYLILQANAASPPRLPADRFIGMLILFLAGLAVWIGQLYRRFRKPR